MTKAQESCSLLMPFFASEAISALKPSHMKQSSWRPFSPGGWNAASPGGSAKISQPSPPSTVANGHRSRWLFRRVVVQILPEPSLDFCHAHPLAFVIVGDLIAVDLA
jgi:hypothetical protein